MPKRRHARDEISCNRADIDEVVLQRFLDANPDAKDEYDHAVAEAVADAKRTAIKEYRYRVFMQEREAIRRLLPTSCRHDKFFYSNVCP